MSDSGSGLVASRIHRALSRSTLLWGADREMVLLTGLMAVILIFVLLTVVTTIIGVVIWIVAVGILRMMAKADPDMRRIYLRQMKYRHYYLPTSSPWRTY